MPEDDASIELFNTPLPQKGIEGKNGGLGCLCIKFAPTRNLSLPGNGGRALHGMFLSLVALIDPHLADYLHHADGIKPFSLTPLQGIISRHGRSFLTADSLFSFEIHLLDSGLLTTVIAALSSIGVNSEKLNLASSPVRILEVSNRPDSHLVHFANLLENARTEKEIILEFLSPTAFRVAGNNLPFPLPKLVFQSLQAHWEAFSTVALPQDLASWVPLVRVSRYELKTELIHYSRFKTIGFTGRVFYELPAEMPDTIQKAFNCLADFAFYAGTGAKTTMGMGQTRRINNARSILAGTGDRAPQEG